MPIFENYVDVNTVALVMSDNGQTYLNLGEEFGVERHTVCHKRRFVNKERVQY